MTVPVWPAEPFPQRVAVDGFGKGLPDGRLRLPMDSGPGKMRRRSTSAFTPVGCQTPPIQGADVARFERFWVESTRGGSLPFLIPDQLRDGRKFLDDNYEPVLDEDDDPILVTAWWLAVFADTPSITAIAGEDLYRIAFELHVLP